LGFDFNFIMNNFTQWAQCHKMRVQNYSLFF
jgi:hypothetical protein